MATTINYLSLTGLQKYDSSIKAFVSERVAEGNANSFKYVNLEDGVLKFYTVNPIEENTIPDFEITLPEQDLSHLMQLVANATSGNVAIFNDLGQVTDGNLAAADIATKAEVEAVQTSVDQLSAYVGEIPEDEAYADITTVIGYVNKKAEETLNAASGGSSESAASVLAALNTYKSENNAKVQDNTDAISVLNGDAATEGSVDKKIADAINVFATQITDDDTINTYKEVLNYIATHGGEANAMMAAIDQLELLVGDKAVATQIAEAIANENLAQYATDEELAAAIARIAVLEGATHTHDNKTVLDGVTAEKVASWDAAESNAIAYADAEIAKVNATIGTVTESKTVVQLLAEAREAAESASNAYTDEKVAEVNGEIVKVNNAITALSEAHSSDKEELIAADEALDSRIVALENVQHIEISQEQIDQLFQ